MIGFGREISTYSCAKSKEFLLSAEGSYCSQSLAGNTRKYHGLLVHRGRVLFSTCDEFLNGERISVASYAGTVQDKGLRHRYGFSLYPPRFFYAVGGAVLCKTIEFDGQCHLRYTLWGEGELRIVPLVTDRSIHDTRGTPDIAGRPTVTGVQMDHLTLSGDGCTFTPGPNWYRNVWYEEDFARGFACQEALYTPGCFETRGRNWSASLHAAVPGGEPPHPSDHRVPRDPLSCLRTAARDFLVGETLIAGYHWFPESWGRDTFVSLPGLLLTQEMFREAEVVFRYFARRMKRGLIPNRIPDSYHSSDATLWFVWALGEYERYGGRRAFIAEMKPYLEEIMARYGESEIASLDGDLIRVTPQSTWMDTAWTPREGKPVEINALWIHALTYATVCDLETPVRPQSARRSFGRFWNEEKGYFCDRIDPVDTTLRPNQIFALSLGLANPEQETRTLEVIRKHLLTPYGLRTLAPGEPGYQGCYAGDASYHNGSVWPWLLGPYVQASLHAGGNPNLLRILLQPLFTHLYDAGLGTVSEYFDGDPPHLPRGCIAQAWSVAEVLRGHRLIEDTIGNNTSLNSSGLAGSYHDPS
ncbi:MAG: amylo-alpha-1,6-glucosidase [Methanomicrobiales archaeon]|nr:amylo-alpha-1,6-glucosidase [Methanomicrobiales archaeon]